MLATAGLLAAVAVPAHGISVGARIALYGQGTVEACAACHGPQGQGRPHFAYPRLAGLNRAYLLRALQAFRTGRRLNGIMTPITRALPLSALAAVADYYAAFSPPPPVIIGAGAQRWPRGAALYAHGDLADHVVACSRCHGARGQGFGPVFPRVAGQTEGYLEQRLRSFRAGAAHDFPLGLMQSAARPLSDIQIRAVAFYLATLGTRPPPAIGAPVIPVARVYDPYGFMPPHRAAVPSTPVGAAVLRGRAIFDHTPRTVPEYVGNQLSCDDCHIAEGRAAGGGPMWAAAGLYPRFYHGHLTTLGERIGAAFVHDENGSVPPLHGAVIVDLLAYIHWMSLGVPIGSHVTGRGYPPVVAPKAAPSLAVGAHIYVQRCALCHGRRGAGQDRGQTVAFPPVWGRGSYSRHSALARLPMAAAFLRATMPYGEPRSLSAVEAYDLAAFLNAKPRPP
ncbi:MAG: c-type cytochrome [Acidiferrobacter sp.]